MIEGFSFSDNLITDGFLELFMYQTYSIAKSGSWIMLFFLNRVFSQLPCYLYIFQGKPETGALKVFQRRKYSLKYYQTSNLFCLPPKIVGYLFFLLENGWAALTSNWNLHQLNFYKYILLKYDLHSFFYFQERGSGGFCLKKSLLTWLPLAGGCREGSYGDFVPWQKQKDGSQREGGIKS